LQLALKSLENRESHVENETRKLKRVNPVVEKYLYSIFLKINYLCNLRASKQLIRHKTIMYKITKIIKIVLNREATMHKVAEVRGM